MNENMMTTNDNLMHWGIKGQKWGVRRYQNPDGTLTEEGIRRYSKKYPYQNPDGSLNERGQKEYMTAAKKGKIDLDSLPDKELDMINQRFNRENTFKNNVSKYEESTFEYKLKQAVLNRIKGGGGGGGKKGKGGGGKKGGITGIGSLLAMPIKKAFEDAFKTTNSGGGGGNKDDDKKSAEDEWYEKVKAQRAFTKGYDPRPEKFDADVKRGQEAFWRSMESWKNRDHDRGNRSSEDILGDRSKNRKSNAREDTRPRNMRSLPSGGIYMDPDEYTIHSELMHYGIKGQKWGVRRFENLDGTLTAEGKARYRKDADGLEERFKYGKTKYSDLPIKERLKKSWYGNDKDAEVESGNIAIDVRNAAKKGNAIVSLDQIKQTPEHEEWEKEYKAKYDEVQSKYKDELSKWQKETDRLDYGGDHKAWKNAFDKLNAVKSKINAEMASTAKKQDAIISKYQKKAFDIICTELGIPSKERDTVTSQIIWKMMNNM